jgi:CTP-dependent riboflavin kinase
MPVVVSGRVTKGVGDFRKRMIAFPNAFSRATGEILFPGTLNIKVDRVIPIKENFRVLGADIGEPEQDLLFEICHVGQIGAYRIRPFNVKTGEGGHGDDMIEIASSQRIPNAHEGASVTITFLRDDI